MLNPFIAASALLLALATGAAAAPVAYDLSLVFNDGPLRNQLYAGTFRIEGDGLSGLGTEVFAAAESERQLLSLDVAVNGAAFSLANADEPELTSVTFVDGQFSRIQYLGAAGTALLAIDSTARFVEAGSGAVSRGVYVARPAGFGAPAPVPLPSAAASLAASLGLLLAWRGRPRAGAGVPA